MSEVGKLVHDSVLAPPKVQNPACKNCGSPLELYELDVRKSAKVMQCARCGVLHIYKKDIFGKWKLLKAQKPEIPVR